MSQRRRLVYYVVTVIGAIVSFALLYNYGMRVWEGRPQPLLQSVEVVLQTFTTVGYGEDAPWETSEMRLVVITMQATGLLLIFTALPALVVPLLKNAMETTAPKTAPPLDDHVIICGFTSRAEELIAELERRDVPYLLVESNRDRANELYAGDYSIIHGDPESIEVLERAHLTTAIAVVTDVDAATNASIALAASEANSEARIVSFVEDPALSTYHEHAGADQVFSPRQLLGRSLADKTAPAVSPELGDSIEIGEEFDIVELPLQSGSDLIGTTLAESDVNTRTGAEVIGIWMNGEFRTPPPPETPLTEQTILLVAGSKEQIEQLTSLTRVETQQYTRGELLIAGYGVAGTTVAETLSDADIPYTVLDIEEGPDVDVVGDVMEPEALREASLEEMSTVILTVADDTVAVYATLIIRNMHPGVEILVRANETGNVRKLYQAGADYVLALATVSGRMLASALLDGDDILSFNTQVRILRTAVPDLEDRRIDEISDASPSEVRILAVERGGNVIGDLDPSFRIQPEDSVIVAGTDEGVNQFTEQL